MIFMPFALFQGIDVYPTYAGISLNFNTFDQK
jgi:hypothetical protein